MGVGDGAGERVGGVGLFHPGGGQQPAHHRLHLLLVGVAGTDHGFLDVVGRVFGDLEPGLRGGQQRDGAGMAELERGEGSLCTKACSTAMAAGACSAMTAGNFGCTSKRQPRPLGTLVNTPWAICGSRCPKRR